MPGIGIVTNPNSRRNRRNPEQLRRLGYILGQEADRHEMTQQPEDIRRVAEHFRSKGVEVLALNGGDGTNHVTLTTFIDVYGDEPLPLIAFLRGGTMNTISNAVGIKGTPGRILLEVSEKYHTGQAFEVKERDILRVDYDGHHHYGFIFGNGLIANYLDAYYDTPSRGGPVAAFSVLMQGIGSALVGGPFAKRLFQPFRALVTVDGEPWTDGESCAVVAATIEQIGLGFRPFIRCREKPGAFHLLAVKTSALGFGLQLPRIRLGMPVDPALVPSIVAHEAVFTADTPISFTIDGDMHRAVGPLRLSAGPRLRIIVR